MLRCLEQREGNRKGSYDDDDDDDNDKNAETDCGEVNEAFTKHLSILRLDKPTALERDGGTATDQATASGKHSQTHTQRRKDAVKKPPPLHLGTSCSSLYSPTASPTHSSMSSLDSAFSQHSADFSSSSTSCPPPGGCGGGAGGVGVGGPRRMSGSASPCSSMGHISPRSPTQVSQLFSIPATSLIPPSSLLRESPPKECYEWTHLKSGHGLHPNSWLKRDRRLSLSRENEAADLQKLQESLVNGLSKTVQGGKERRGLPEPAEVGSGAGPRRRSTSPPSYQQALVQVQTQRSKSMLYSTPNDKPLTVRELRELHNKASSLPRVPTAPALLGPRTGRRPSLKTQISGGDLSEPPQAMFYVQNMQNPPTAYRGKSHSLIPSMSEKLLPRTGRRASEPVANLSLDRESTLLGLEKLHRQAVRKSTTDPDIARNQGLRISRSDQEIGRGDQGGVGDPRFCLSPAATRAVRDYFSSQNQDDPHGSLRKSQEVALAIVQGKREWSRRCSDPKVEDFDQLLFAEESYV